MKTDTDEDYVGEPKDPSGSNWQDDDLLGLSCSNNCEKHCKDNNNWSDEE